MLADSFSIPMYVGTPCFTHSCKLDNIFEDILVEVIPEFLNSLTQQPHTKQMNEKNFTQDFVTEIYRALVNNPRGVIVIYDYNDIYTKGADPNKCVDFAFATSTQGASKKSLYAVEAKRLPTGTGKREREYIYGYFKSGSPAGGIQRFKTEDHGYGLSHSGLLGYIEDNDFTHWHSLINRWIVEDSLKAHGWKDEEQLRGITIDPTSQNYSISRSIAHRASDSINLFHLWIKIPKEINYYTSAQIKPHEKD